MNENKNLNIVKPGNPELINRPAYKVKDYIEHFSRLVELERREEMNRHEKEMRELSGKERENKGRAVLNAFARDKGTGLGGRFLVKLIRKNGLPETEISVGDLIQISKLDQGKKKTYSAV